MPPVKSPSDPFARRREAGAASRGETRRRLLAAADALFRERGYPATAVAAIAERAGVSLQTLYLAWGSKRALLRAATDAAAAASQLPVQPDEWRASIRAALADAAGREATASEYLAAVGRLFVQIAERTAPYWRMHRQAAATDPEVAADWAALTAARRRTLAEVARGVPPRGVRPGLTADAITETLWALASPELYDLFTAEGGYEVGTFQAWLTRTLVAALCED